MCDYEAGDGERPRIDQGLYEAARRIELRLAGPPVSNTAWNVFFGRAGGALVWSDYQRIKACYAKAEIAARLSTTFKPSGFVCEATEAEGAGGFKSVA
jgi:hypothetical protein